MAIWYRHYSLEDLNLATKGNMCARLGIEFTAIGENYVEATMPVDQRTWQPAGLLHGGASVALAESLGSIAGQMCVDQSQKICVGQEINANHLRPVKNGKVVGRAEPLYIGRSSHVWQIEIRNARGKLVCASRLTLAVVANRTGQPQIRSCLE